MGRVDMRDTEVRLNSRIDTTNENMQAQFAQHPAAVTADVWELLAKQS